MNVSVNGETIAGWFVGRRQSVSNDAVSTSKTFTTLDVRLDGVLLKQGSWRKNWKERFFVLRRDAVRLAYYDGPKTLKLLGEVVLVCGASVASVAGASPHDEPARPGYAPFSVRSAASLFSSRKEARDRTRQVRCALKQQTMRLQARSPRTATAGSTPCGPRSRTRRARTRRPSLPRRRRRGPRGRRPRRRDDDDDDGPAPPLPCAITPEKIEAAVRRGGTSELRAGAATGLQATLHLKGARVDRMDEDGLFVVAFRCDDEAWDEVARTEVVKAGASGAFASGPCGFAVYMKHGHAAPLASHRRLFRTRLDGAEASALAGRSRGAVLDVPLHREEQAQPDDDEDVSETASSSSGTANALAAPSRGSVAYRPAEPRRPARRASPAATSGRLLLCGVDGAGLFAGSGGAAPYGATTTCGRRSDGAGVRYGHVVAAETIAVPAAAGDLPAALLGLLAAERRALRGARRRRRRARRSGAPFECRAKPMRSRELDFAATKIEAIADQLAAMRDELEAQAAHADDVADAAARFDLRVAAPFLESPGGVAAVENPLARGGHRLKRSTLKKDAALQFLPTNLNWHQLRARRQPDHPHDAARTSNLQPDFNVTFGATAAHAKHLGFRDGGLQKLVDRSEAYVDGGDAAASSTRRRALRVAARALLALSARRSGRGDARRVRRRGDAVRGGATGAAAREPHRGRPAAVARGRTPAARRRPRATTGRPRRATSGGARSSRSASTSSAARPWPSPRPTSRPCCAARPRVAAAARRALAGAGGGGALLLGVECLLSTHGDELGMLEDLVAATEWMDSLTFAFVDRPRGAEADNAAGDWAVSRRPGGGGALLVERRVDGPLLAACRAAGPPGAAVELRPRRGINEWQTVCNLQMAGDRAAQACANAAGLAALEAHVARGAISRELGRRRDAAARRRELAAWAAALRGAVAPAVADGTPGRTNLLLNTGQDKYAFNAVQVKSLPVCYRPPAGTYTGNALT
ncbi:hypothetical protein JL720_8313 [Aureococcus anophagefferens]|nr:hypothetical protein JL720_8313 [Aureococcus anophagefferens]